jgi:L-asparaginase
MKKQLLFNSLLVILLMLVAIPATQAQNKDLPNIVILATGGTIAGTGASSTGSAYTSGKVTIDAMIDAVPNIRKLANLTGEQTANVGSQDMSVEVWLTLANRINELLATDDVDGIVITHGTDTQEETAYFLNLVVKSEKPVVMVSAMRPSTALSADGPLNLYNGVAVAANPDAKGRGILVAINDDIHSAHAVKKLLTTPVQAFMSPEHGLLGTVNFGQVEFFHKPHGIHTVNSEFSIDGVKELPRVDIVYGCADMSTDLIDIMVKAGAKGIVIAGVGDGNMNKGTLEAAKKATQQGIPVVRSARVPIGSVLIHGEVVDEDYGTISSDELNPQKARILLMMALQMDKNMSREKLQELFINY